jgi:hypothetical protein
MGLDIVAYQGLTKTDAEENIHVSHNEFGYNSDLQTGWYDCEGESFHFRAGSYSGYNSWRRALCEAIHGVSDVEFWKDEENFIGQPFYELINFSDCEGQIGPKVAEKLYQDFANPENEKKFLDYCKAKFETEYLEEFYQANWEDFKKAFEIARLGGLVQWC